MYTLPNTLTLLRIGFIPLFVVAFYLPIEAREQNFWATLVFFIACITDWFDGYLARKLNQSSPFGAFLDPVADKIMVAVAIVLIAVDFDTPWVTIPAIIIISREIVISALREWMAERGERSTVAVGNIGKFKTAAQMLAIGGLIWQQSQGMLHLAYGLLYLAATLTLWSMIVYLANAWKTLSAESNK